MSHFYKLCFLYVKNCWDLEHVSSCLDIYLVWKVGQAKLILLGSKFLVNHFHRDSFRPFGDPYC